MVESDYEYEQEPENSTDDSKQLAFDRQSHLPTDHPGSYLSNLWKLDFSPTFAAG